MAAGSDQPIVGATAQQRGAGEEGDTLEEATTDATGSFMLDCMPREGTVVVVQISGGDQDRPTYPAETRFSVTAEEWDSGSAQGPLDVKWEVPRLRWLIAAYPDERDRRVRQSSGPGYPVFFVERQNKASNWDQLTDPIMVQGNGTYCFGVREPGTYRGAVAVGSVQAEFTDAALLAAETFDARVEWEAKPATTAPLRIRVVQKFNGYPSAGTRLFVRGHRDSGMPLELTTDEKGEAELGPVNAANIYVAFDDAGQKREAVLSPAEAKDSVLLIELDQP